jgi:hypothetical protein
MLAAALMIGCAGSEPTQVSALALQTATGPLTSWDFGSTMVGSESVGLLFEVSNDTPSATGLIALAFVGSDASDFKVDGVATTCDDQIVLAPGASCNVLVRFAPSSALGKSASLEVTANPGGAATLSLTGTGASPPDLAFAPPWHDFGVIEFGVPATQDFQISNAGASTVGITRVDIDQKIGTGFRVDATTCLTTLAPGATCNVTIRFDPTAFGQDSAGLTITTDLGTISQGVNWVIGYGAGRLTIVKDGAGSGTVTSDGGGNPNIDCGATCSGLFIYADHTLTASATVSKWSVSTCPATSSTCNVSLSTTPTIVTVTFP